MAEKNTASYATVRQIIACWLRYHEDTATDPNEYRAKGFLRAWSPPGGVISRDRYGSLYIVTGERNCEVWSIHLLSIRWAGSLIVIGTLHADSSTGSFSKDQDIFTT